MLNIFKKSKKEPENISEVLDHIKQLDKDIERLTAELKSLQEKSLTFFQKIGVVRFNPFSDVGGNQSFVIAMLDAQNNGFVITSFYGREGNRVYAKSVEGGQSKHQLSEEEKEAIIIAVSSGNSLAGQAK